MINLFRSRELTSASSYAAPSRRPHRVLAGAVEQIADALATWFLGKAAEGILSHHGLELFVEHVVPRLGLGDSSREEFLG